MTKWIKYWFAEPLPCTDGTKKHKWVSGSAKVVKGKMIMETKQCKVCGLIQEINQPMEM